MLKITLFKSLLLVCLLMIGAEAWAESVTSTFKDNKWGVGTDEPAWTKEGANATSFESASPSRGVQTTLTNIKSSGLSLSNSTIKELGKISSITLEVSSNGTGGSISSVTVGSTSFTNNGNESYTVSKSNGQTVTFSGTATEGDIVITFASTATDKSLYVKSITVVYDNDDRSTPTATWEYNGEEAESITLDITDATSGITFTSNSNGTISYESDNTSVASIDEKGKITLNGTGIATITASVAGSTTYKPADKDVIIIVTDKNKPVVTWSVSDYTFENGEIISSYIKLPILIAFGKGTNTSNNPKYYNTGTAVRCYGGNTITVTAPQGHTIIGIKMTFGKDDGTNAINVNEGEFSKGTWAGESNEVIFTIGGTTGNRRITDIDVTYTKEDGYIALPMIVTDAKYATFCAPFEVNVPEGITASTADAVKANGGITLTETSVIPANTPVILSSEAAVTKIVAGIPTDGTPAYGVLVGTYETTEAPVGSYVLQNHEGKVGFYKVTIPVSIDANRCYLVSTSEAKAFYLEEEDATAINGINAEGTNSNAIYNIAGQRVNKAGKGIYIVDGKKVLY